MAYPASNFIEKTYRNSINDVADYLNKYHKDNYLIINVSSRPYDSTLFHDRVQGYEWPDHQAPALTTLFLIAYETKQFLDGKLLFNAAHPKGVVAVHCNHGKGRTGTAIISFILYIGYITSASDCLNFYNQQRFNVQTYGVDQPCQRRYLDYVATILKQQ